MNDYKKQALAWAITLVVAACTLVSAKQVGNTNYEADLQYEEAMTSVVDQPEEEAEEHIADITEVEEANLKNAGSTDVMNMLDGTTSVSIGIERKIEPTSEDNPVDTAKTEDVSTEILYHDEENKLITLQDGTSFSYLYADVSDVTAYCACLEICCTHQNLEWYGKTLSGRDLLAEEEPKVLAADISRYPLGTVIFVPGYGIATVEDSGGAIDDRDLDVYFHNHEKASEWGYHDDQIVYIISFGEWK